MPKFRKSNRAQSAGARDSLPPSPLFRCNEEVPQTGLYRVYHSEHRVSHNVIVFAGQHFPCCNKCGEAVHFEFLAGADQIGLDRDFQSAIHVHVIPHPEEADEQQRTA